MFNPYDFAVKLHDACCPKCNGRCGCGGFCRFTHTPANIEWESNPANAYFLELARKAEKIMNAAEITEEQLLEYAKAKASANDSAIPENVVLLMQEHDFN